MKLSMVACIFSFGVYSLQAQTKAGLLRDNALLQANDTISLSYPSGEAILIAVLLDEGNNVIGSLPVQWSVSGNIAIVDTPYISNKVLIDASLALTDQKGFLSASASSSAVTWVSNRVFLKIKGKNSGIIQIMRPDKNPALYGPTIFFTASGQEINPTNCVSAHMYIIKNFSQLKRPTLKVLLSKYK